MAIIQRPGKEGNATTYQGKVAAGYSNILAQEVDADIDAIYSAWNQGVDTVNIKPGAVGPAQLAPGAVGPSALGPLAVQTGNLADGAVTTGKILDGTIQGADIAPATLTDSLIANVAWTKLIAPLLSTIAMTPRAVFQDDGSAVNIIANHGASPSPDGTKPSWMLKLNYTADTYEVWRAPPSTTNYVRLFWVDANGIVYANHAVYSNRIVNPTTAPNNPNYSLSTPAVWSTVTTLPSLVTTGNPVQLYASHGLSALGTVGGARVAQRWTRDGNPLTTWSFLTTSTAYVPFPGISWLDIPTAGAHTYAYQIQVASGAQILGSGVADSGFLAVEVG